MGRATGRAGRGTAKGIKKRSRSTKFFNRKTVYKGETYDSILEAKWAQALDGLLQNGQVDKVERQVPLRLEVNNTLVCKMIVDFRLLHNGRMGPAGTYEWVEVKGMPTPVWRLKKKLLEALFPGLVYTVVK